MNEDKKAIAISYDESIDDAPKIIAKGDKELAKKIIKIAQDNNIAIHQDTGLATLLSGLEIDSIIPVEAYVAVAEILSYVLKKSKNEVSNESVS